MANQGTFGRRTAAQAPQPLTRPQTSGFGRPAQPLADTEGLFRRAQVEAALLMGEPIPLADAAPSVDDELREWKASRETPFRLPWRQLSLMASLCFGIASFVLPDSVNDMVNWLLYGLMAVSFCVGITGRKKKAKA